MATGLIISLTIPLMSRNAVLHQLDGEISYRYLDIDCSFWVLFCAKLRNLTHNAQSENIFSPIILATIHMIAIWKYYYRLLEARKSSEFLKSSSPTLGEVTQSAERVVESLNTQVVYTSFSSFSYLLPASPFSSYLRRRAFSFFNSQFSTLNFQFSTFLCAEEV